MTTQLERDRARYKAKRDELVAYKRSWRLRKQEALAGRPCPERCEICNELPTTSRGGRLHFDHDHKTGAFRGWICSPCNLIVGFIELAPARLPGVTRYLS